MYNNATIISLEPSNTSVGSSAVSSVRSATFEEAFGEYSELRGKRRKKRQDRKMDRIEARKERKTGRIEGRKAKRLARVESRDEVRSARQDKRIARKTDRKLGRQTRRTDVMEARQGRRTGRMEQVQDRRTARKGKRIERRALGQEDDFETEDTQTTPTGVEPITRPVDTTEQGGGYSDEQDGGSAPTGGGYSDEQGGGSAPTGGGYSDEQGGGYSDEQGGDYSEEGYSDEQGGDYSDEGYSDEQGGDYSDESEDSGDYSDESEMGDYETEDEGYDYSEPFDGIPVDASFSEMDDSGKAAKKINVQPKLQDLVNKIEWNKELVTRLEAKRTQGVVNPSEVSKSIIDRKRRIQQLQAQLEMYLGFAGDYSGANGMSERQVNNEVARRRMEVGKAHRIARAIRKGAKDERFVAKMTNKSISAKMKGTHGGDITPVDIDLKPEFSKRRIVVPASEFSGTGIIGLDQANDYDARELDVQLGADGDLREPYGISKDFYYGANGETTRKINWTGVILGVAVGALAIYGIKKYNLLKK